MHGHGDWRDRDMPGCAHVTAFTCCYTARPCTAVHCIALLFHLDTDRSGQSSAVDGQGWAGAEPEPPAVGQQ